MDWRSNRRIVWIQRDKATEKDGEERCLLISTNMKRPKCLQFYSELENLQTFDSLSEIAELLMDSN